LSRAPLTAGALLHCTTCTVGCTTYYYTTFQCRPTSGHSTCITLTLVVAIARTNTYCGSLGFVLSSGERSIHPLSVWHTQLPFCCLHTGYIEDCAIIVPTSCEKKKNNVATADNAQLVFADLTLETMLLKTKLFNKSTNE